MKNGWSHSSSSTHRVSHHCSDMGNSCKGRKRCKSEDADDCAQSGEGRKQHSQHNKFSIQNQEIGHYGTHDAARIPNKPVPRV